MLIFTAYWLTRVNRGILGTRLPEAKDCLIFVDFSIV